MITAATLLISVAILGFLVYSQREALFSGQLALRPAYLVGAFLIYLVNLLLAAVAWASIMKSLGAHLPFATHLRYFCLSLVARRIPGTVWYIASRAALYREEGVSGKDSSVASGIEAGVATISAVIGSLLFGVPILAQVTVSYWGLVAAVIVSLVLVHPRIVTWVLRRMGREVERFRYRDLATWISLYLLAWIVGGFMLWLTANGISQVALEHLPLFIGSWCLISLLSSLFFFSPSNLGITEVGLSLMLGLVVPTSIAVLIAVFGRVLYTTFEFSITGALILLGLGKNKPN